MISFDCQDGKSFPSDFDAAVTMQWLHEVALKESKEIEHLQYVLCDDAFLIDINQEYLNHDTYTDIITFPYKSDPINAEIYISIDRVKENAMIFTNGSVLLELDRVLVHGLLHMCGYNDLKDAEKKLMRGLETQYLDLKESGLF